MADRPLVILVAISLLMAAVGLLLWRWAGASQARGAITRHLDQRIRASYAQEQAPVDPGQNPLALQTAVAANGTTLLTDPWLEPASTKDSAGKARRKIELPGWLEGAVTIRALGVGAAAVILLCAVAAWAAGWIGAASAALVLPALGAFWVWLRVQKFRRQLVSQMPPFIDAMVRLITVGNSTQAAFQLALASTQLPLQGYLERSASLVRAGMDLDRALNQTAEGVGIEEMFLLASILGLGVRYGGRADLLLERVAHFMRDRQQAQQELIAMSAETRLSAWVLGLLPVVVGGAIIMLNPNYFLRMWSDPTGQGMVATGLGLQILGAVLLYRLAKLS